MSRTKADAKAELILLVRSDSFAPPEQCVVVADALERTLIGNRGKGWLELVVKDENDLDTLRTGCGDDGTLTWAAALVLQMPIGERAEIRITNG